MPPTLKEIAERLGVSVQAVSVALNKPPEIARLRPELRERIIETAQEMGYQPNAFARALVHGRSRLLGLLTLAPSHPPYSGACDGIAQEAAAAGYGVLMCGAGGLDTAAQHLATFAAHKVEGIVAVATSAVGRAEEIIAHRPADTPLIAINREIASSDAFSILMDNRDAVRQATEHLIHLGHRRIAYLDLLFRTLRRPLQSSIERREGYIAAMEAAGLAPLVGISDPQDPAKRVSAAEHAARELLGAPEPPTAFCGVTDWEAIGALRVCASLNLDVPEDVAVFGFDNTEAGQWFSPAVSTVRPAFYEAGRMAVRHVLNWSREPASGVTRLPCELIFRESAPALLAGDPVQ